MKLFWSPNSSATRILWALEEIGLQYEIAHIDILARPREDPADFLAISPLGKVPALQDGDRGIWGSAQICVYLADRYASGELAPSPDDEFRAEYIQWMFFVPSALEPAMMEKFMGLEPNKEATGWGSWDLMSDQLIGRIQDREWIVGDRFSAADIMICSSCELLLRFGLIEATEAMRAYMARCEARAAYQAAIDRGALFERRPASKVST